MNYCSQCGAPVSLKVPPGDTLPRYICDVCGTIHYQNPNVVAGCIPEWEGKVLLCRRAIQPRYGLWTLPAGFMENGETTQQAAARETREEAGADIQVAGLFAMFSLPHISQVYVMFRARLTSPEFAAGEESLEVGLYDERDIPWDHIAFPVIKETLRHYYRDRARGRFDTHIGDIIRVRTDPPEYRIHMLNTDL